MAGGDGRKKNSGGYKKSSQPSAALIAAKKRAQQQKKNGMTDIMLDDPYQVAEESKKLVKIETAMITEPRMAEHLCLWDRNYPECPERLTQTVQRCRELGLIDRCKCLVPQSADQSDILAVHSEEAFNILKATSGSKNEEELEKLSSKYDAIYIHPTSYELALLAAGSAVELVEAVCNNKVQNGMALIRPPGHHAMESTYCGYCFFNNAAVATQRALDEVWAKRVLIVDWDVHHGQATQQAFFSDPRVLYFSIHRYEHGEFWPNLEESNYNYVGEGEGRGFNSNIPLNTTGMGDADYLAIFQHILLPMAHEFQPDLIVISAGYDAAIGCPEFAPDLVLISAGFDSALGDEKGEMVVTPGCYAHLINLLSVLAGGKIAVLLEGGYCLQSLAESAALTLRALLGDPCPRLGSLPAPSRSIQTSILNSMYALRPYWETFKQQPTFNSKENRPGVQRHVPEVCFKGPTELPPETFATRDCYPIQSETFKSDINSKLTALIKDYHYESPAHRVGFVYDEGMLEHYNTKERSHVECPERAAGIFAKHKEYNLLERCYRLQARHATEEQLQLVHSKKHVEKIVNTKNQPLEKLHELSESFNSIYLHPSTWTSASLAAGCVIEAVDSVLTGTCQSAVAVVRPPGHHAERDVPCGFCVFNNVALAAQHAVNKYNLKRVLLLDWDVHHGNGTQHIFEQDPRVMYVSIHRYDNGSFFPASISPAAAAEAAADFVGRGEGKGFTINIPWNKRNMGDSEYVAAFLQVVLPVAYQFDPELVLISAGFDAAIKDPLGGCKVSPEMYGQMTRWLQGLAHGRVVLALEGGYNVSSISYSLTMCTKALLGDPIPRVSARSPPCPSAVNSIRSTQQALAPYWSSLCLYNKALPAKDGLIPVGSYKSKAEMTDLSDALSALSIKETAERSINLQQLDSAQILKQEPVDADQADKPGSSNSEDTWQSEAGPSTSGASASDSASGITTLKEYLAECMKSGEEMYALIPRTDCPHLNQVQPVPEGGVDVHSGCQECGNVGENWVCLHCYTVHCGRFIEQHMEMHSIESEHPLVLSQADLSVWCYACDAYVDAPALYSAKNSAHVNKFGEEMPWTYDTPLTLQMT